MAVLNVCGKIRLISHPALSPVFRQARWGYSHGRSAARLLRAIPNNATVRIRSLHNARIRMLSSERDNQSSPTTVRAVTVQVAQELLNAGHHYLDVRTAEEFAAGHIEGAVNIPYMCRVGSGMTKNLNFLEDVSSRFDKGDEIVVGCQMGKRSQMATSELVAAGFMGLTDMPGGFAGWVQSGMPTKTSV